ncbi:MAG: DUF881 domain-containing protein [Actinomycetota bacterium]
MTFDEREQHWYGGRRPSMRPPARIQSRAALAAVAVLIGFLLAVQATRDPGLSRLAAESPEDLTRILADLSEEADELTRQVAALKVRVSRYRSSARTDELAVRDARDTLSDLQVLAGVVAVQGPGVRITVDDPSGQVEWDAVLDLIQELRDAGAEAMAIGEIRVVASTWFGPSDDGVAVGGDAVSAPYEISAIGPSEELAQAMSLPGGPLTVIDARPDVEIRIRTEDDLVLPAAVDSPAFEHARAAS